MASFNGPKLTNPIGTDVPDTQEVLIALAKQDPTSISDTPSGAKRLYEASSGKWQWQLYNGTSWAPVPFLQHNVDQLDGYHAAITPAANTVAVRNADKKLEGDITGNAATASSAATLSQTLPVNKGGTGATTSEAARSNLGVPPTSHASANTTHGVGNATQYGHLKLSDATNNLSGVSGGVAATPAAVKAAMTKASTLATTSTPGIVKPGTGMTVDAAGALNVTLNNTVTSTSTTQAATANAVKTAYDKAEEAASKAGLPLGHIFAWPFPTAPDGCIILNGSTYDRTLYADLFVYVKSKGWTKTETEWQNIALANNGFCPWYSEGDGSTTFRTPKFAPYQKLALASGDAGKYYSAGLPNITGAAGDLLWNTHIPPFSNGSFSYGGMGDGQWAWIGSGEFWSGSAKLYIDASRSNSIYGNSTTVRPESHDWIVCVVAFGTATNVGSVDVANVMSAVGQVQANAHVVETWKSGNGSSWYRKWSDGFIEQGQGGVTVTKVPKTITFNQPFTSSTYQLITEIHGVGSNSYGEGVSIQTKRTTSFVCHGHNATDTTSVTWYACGY